MAFSTSFSRAGATEAETYEDASADLSFPSFKSSNPSTLSHLDDAPNLDDESDKFIGVAIESGLSLVILISFDECLWFKHKRIKVNKHSIL